MIIEQLAVLFYGALAVIAALVAASIADSTIAASLAFAGSGLIYVFQTVQLIDERSRALYPLWAVSIGLLLASVATSIIGSL